MIDRRVLTVILSAIFLKIVVSLSHKHNVCHSWDGYYTDKDCYYNPDQHSELAEIVQRRGYTIEEYQVETKDHYYLKVFRIPKPGKTPVFLIHGLYSSSISFVLAGNHSLAFVLAEAGYDVWLGNFRGSRYSRGHKFLHDDSFKYWDFSLHELGVYDISTQLELINKITEKPIAYIGFSLGTIAGHIYSATYPTRAKQIIKVMISMAPTALLETSISGLRTIGPLFPSIAATVNAYSHGELLPRNGVIKNVINSICLPYPHQMRSCLAIIQSGFGFSEDQINPETLPIILAQDRDSISMKVVLHQRQIVHSRKFRQFDYGHSGNVKEYHQDVPPLYHLNDIRVPNHFIRAKGDLLGTKNAVEELYHYLPDDVQKGIYVVDHPTFSHTDFLWGKDAYYLVYKHILEFLSTFK
ncbi:gastric triacylglycerol lipase-like [Onthophagus taurus]|uniref:gastric triacylglycerol lipase-like n=1 Tax=Onthophagus taurus TaxID=166361 RepID=UPI0039BDACE8